MISVDYCVHVDEGRDNMRTEIKGEFEMDQRKPKTTFALSLIPECFLPSSYYHGETDTPLTNFYTPRLSHS